MKSYTDLEQSKKLVEILPIESADMFWYRDAVTKEVNPRIMNYIQVPELQSMYYSPCWSLAALLALMPKLYEFENDPDDGGCQPNLCKGWDNNQWHIVYRYSIYYTEWYDEPIDAAFEMVCWLKENGKI